MNPNQKCSAAVARLLPLDPVVYSDLICNVSRTTSYCLNSATITVNVFHTITCLICIQPIGILRPEPHSVKSANFVLNV